MTPLRELNRQVAEWMGYADLRLDTILCRGKEELVSWVQDEDGGYPKIVPHYSTDETAAAEVRDFVRGLGYEMTLAYESRDRHDASFCIFDISPIGQRYSASAPKPPEAIVRAALAVRDAINEEKKHAIG